MQPSCGRDWERDRWQPEDLQHAAQRTKCILRYSCGQEQGTVMIVR